MTAHDRDKTEGGPSSSHEGEGRSTTPQVQTPDKPSQAEGDRETIDASIKEKEDEASQEQ